MIKLTPWYLAAIAPIAVMGCSGTLLGHLAVLAVTLGIFVGTLSLGRHTAGTAEHVGPQHTSQVLVQMAAPIVRTIPTPVPHDVPGDAI